MGDAVSHTFRQMQNGTGLFYGWFEAMHSRFDLLTVGPTENEAAALCRDIAAEIRRIENRLNRFDEASDVWQINQNTFYDKCPADPELLGIFADALRYREMTGGAFDIAIQTPEYLPGESCFAVDPACEAVVKLRPDAIFDFGGYGKGYALQQALGMLKNAGITTALVKFGNSSVCGIGCHPSGDSWQVGVENPLRRGENMTFFGLNDLCLSSSGNLPSNRGHIRSPRTGKPVTDNRIVSVAAPSALDSEVLSTALFVADAAQRQTVLRHFALARVAEMDFTTAGHTTREAV